MLLIGVMAGATGMWRQDVPYGVQIMIVFGFVLGLPIALVVGTVNWLTQPLPDTSAATARTIQRNDRWAAVSSIAAVALVATAGSPTCSARTNRPLGSRSALRACSRARGPVSRVGRRAAAADRRAPPGPPAGSAGVRGGPVGRGAG
ncbi:hypothetical protein ABZ897_38155, partial [Nonomuraea sp. NPDC046802]|uniref:hypothetical protein n=1 Tax=Nonomuraea sp. NPDC046802 TaxID=3154919 RepID=UPI0033FEC8D8